MHREIRQLIRELKRRGVRVDITGKHVRCDTDRGPVFVSKTPSDHRAMQKILSTFRRYGVDLRNPQEESDMAEYVYAFVVPKDTRERSMLMRRSYRVAGFFEHYSKTTEQISKPDFCDERFSDVEHAHVMSIDTYLALTASYRAAWDKEYPNEPMYIDDLTDIIETGRKNKKMGWLDAGTEIVLVPTC